MLKYVLLGFLNYMPMTGYDLEHYIQVSTGNFWHAKLSQIYTTLKKLEESGMVSSHIEAGDGRPDRRVYTITDAGQEDLQSWLSIPLTEMDIKKDTLLLKLFFGLPTGKEAILTQLRLQRDLHGRQMAQYQQDTPNEIVEMLTQRPDLARDALMWNAARRFGELYEDMYVRWLDETIDMVQDSLPDE